MDLRDDIRKVAYYLYEKGGWMHGKDTEHWYEAERIVVDSKKKSRKGAVGVKEMAAPRPAAERKRSVGRHGKPRLGVKTRF
jgi:hypothetical protein